MEMCRALSSNKLLIFSPTSQMPTTPFLWQPWEDTLRGRLHLNTNSMKIHGSVNHQQLNMVLSIDPSLIRIFVVLVAAVGQAEVFSWLPSATTCHKILYTCLLRQLDNKCWMDLCFGFIWLFWTTARNCTISKYPAIKQLLSVFKVRTFRGKLQTIALN